jgi:hypothetical protein
MYEKGDECGEGVSGGEEVFLDSVFGGLLASGPGRSLLGRLL